MNKELKDKFPLYKDDDIIEVQLPPNYIHNVGLLKDAIDTHKLILVENHCMCNNQHPELDIVVSEKDRYGLPIPQVLCSKCGLIRSGKVFDEISNSLFYRDYYRSIYNYVKNATPDEIFYAHMVTSKRLYNTVTSHLDMSEIADVVEIGCSCGYNLYPFFLGGAKTVGFDYNKEYLECGRAKGLNLIYGDFYSQTPDNSFDLVILNHVFEHFLDPINEIKRLLPKIRLQKYLYIEVPGIFYIKRAYGNPISYFQNAHVYNFYEDYLRVLFCKFGLKIIYGDERCTFICQKVNNDIPDVEEIYDDSLSKYVERIARYLLICKNDWRKSWLKRLTKLCVKRLLSLLRKKQ